MIARRLLLFLVLCAPVASGATRITLLHFSDYHSHALPFFSEGRPEQGGVARAVGYLRQQKRGGAIVLNGGDMINKGSPAWSDKYGCAEWPWFNGVVDAMAFGNHDPDYGPDDYQRCAGRVKYPILSANTSGMKGYTVIERQGIRIGVFAVAGRDFSTLVKGGFTFGDPVAAARAAVSALRDTEKVDAVVMIGHESLDDDYELARSVAGIDVIFGSHSHLKRDLTRIDGTNTWFISPFQYLTYISRLELSFVGKKLAGVTGGLVPVNDAMKADREVARDVRVMQRDLERDPKYHDLFTPIGRATSAVLVDGQNEHDTPFGNLVMDVMRAAAHADVALSTSSSFRQSLPRGVIRMEDLRASLPYDNEILIFEMTGAQLGDIMREAVSRRNSDAFLQMSGLRLVLDEQKIVEIATADPGGRPSAIDATKTYRVATTDYLGRVAADYRGFFAAVKAQPTGLRIREETRRYIAAHSPLTIERDGRIADVGNAADHHGEKKPRAGDGRPPGGNPQ